MTAFAIPDVDTPSSLAVSARESPNWLTRWTARCARPAAMRRRRLIIVICCTAKDAPWMATSSSGHEKRHNGKHSKHYDVHRSRHGVPARKVLTDRQAPKPEDETELRDEQQT